MITVLSKLIAMIKRIDSTIGPVSTKDPDADRLFFTAERGTLLPG